MLSLKVLLVLAVISVASVWCTHLPFRWGKRNPDDRLVCVVDGTYDARFAGNLNVRHTEVFNCTLPEFYDQFTYVYIAADRNHSNPNDVRIGMMNDASNKFMRVEFESKYSFNVHLQVWANKTFRYIIN